MAMPLPSPGLSSSLTGWPRLRQHLGDDHGDDLRRGALAETDDHGDRLCRIGLGLNRHCARKARKQARNDHPHEGIPRRSGSLWHDTVRG
jgi:hypothetical protein